MNRTFFLFLQFIFINFSFADTCPVSPLKVEVNLTSSVSYDAKKSIYTYSYVIENKKDSILSIASFRIITNENPKEIKVPKKWIAGFMANNTPNDIVFSALDNILPGKLEKFSLTSSRPPGIVKYYVLGQTGIPSTTPTENDDEPTPNCPGFFYDKPYLEGLVNGFTTGPAPIDQISIDFQLRKMKKEKSDKFRKKDDIDDDGDDFKETCPYKDSGKIIATIRSDKNLDINSIKVSSIKLGPAAAPVEASKIIKEKNKDKIILIFDQQAMGIECDRDRAIFLEGKTIDGKDILGAAPIRTKDCDQRPHHKKDTKNHHHR